LRLLPIEHALQAVVEERLSGYKKSAFLKTPIQTTKYLYKFWRFK